jgi:hypothetical protein
MRIAASGAVLAALAALAVLSGCAVARDPAGSISHIAFPPEPKTHWQIQLGGAFDASVRANVYDLDPYTTDQATVTAIIAAGHRAICHLDAGAADMTLPDAAGIPADVLGAPDGTDRRWLDIRRWDVIRPVLSARLDLCRAKGFQAVDADETYGYANPTGFDLTGADQIAFDRRVADLAHSYGLAAAVRALPEMAEQVEPFADFAVVDGCFTSPACANFFAYIDADKAVYDVETEGDGRRICTLARVYGYAAIRKSDVFDGPVAAC